MLVPDHDHVGGHGHQILGGIDQRLPFFHRGSRCREIERVGGKTFLRDLERDARARRCFHEEVDDQLPAKGRHFLHRPLAHFLESLGRVEDEHDFFGRKLLDAEEVFGFQRGSVGAHARYFSMINTSSSPSNSAMRTLITSSASVGTVLPITSAWMGSSRWPRSIRTASMTARGRPKSINASSAARTVRPVYRTSSTSTTILSSIGSGSLVGL